MKRATKVCVVVASVVASCLPAAAVGQTIARWSFDEGYVDTNASGHITTAYDDVGTHHATTVVAGTAATINSVPGQKGLAAEFANGPGVQSLNHAFMQFPQLTEIAGAAGGSFTVAAWVKTTSTDKINAVLADWGNAPAGTDRFTYLFGLANTDGNNTSRPRGQMRHSNNPDVDIVANTLTLPQAGVQTVADNMWRHLAWVWDRSIGTMHYYIDGQLRHSVMSARPPAQWALLTSDSAVGTIGAKRDTNEYFTGAIDDLWVVDDALTSGELLTIITQTENRLAGDYTDNGVVDGADYVLWRNHVGTSTTLPNDPTHGTVGPDDYERWRRFFGKVESPGVGSGSAVPEPVGGILMGVAAAFFWPRIRRGMARR